MIKLEYIGNNYEGKKSFLITHKKHNYQYIFHVEGQRIFMEKVNTFKIVKPRKFIRSYKDKKYEYNGYILFRRQYSLKLLLEKATSELEKFK